MKKYIYAFVFAISGSAAFAQLAFYEPGTTTNAQAVYNVTVAPGDPTYYIDLDLKNNASSTKTIKMKKTVINTTVGHDVYFCVGTFCYTPATMLSANITLNAGASLPNGQGTYGLKADFDNGSAIGTTSVRYTAYDINTPNDSVSVLINYTVSPVGIAQIDAKNFFISNPSPNPAVQSVTIKYEFEAVQPNTFIKFYNIVGSEIKSIKLEHAEGKELIDITGFADGVYVYTLFVNNHKITTKKFIVSK